MKNPNNPSPISSSLLPTGHGVRLEILAVPNGKKSEILGLHGDPPRIRIRLKAPPVDGAANEELVRFLAELFNVARSRIVLTKGPSSRKKTVEISGISAETVKRCL